MNSVFVNPGIDSCAVDDFLEISTHLFPPFKSTRNDFTDLLFNVCSHYVFERRQFIIEGNTRALGCIWSYIIDVCSSISARDCNACFSQIFGKRTFGYLNEEEESLLRTLRTFDSFYSSSSNLFTLNSNTFF